MYFSKYFFQINLTTDISNDYHAQSNTVTIASYISLKILDIRIHFRITPQKYIGWKQFKRLYMSRECATISSL